MLSDAWKPIIPIRSWDRADKPSRTAKWILSFDCNHSEHPGMSHVAEFKSCPDRNQIIATIKEHNADGACIVQRTKEGRLIIKEFIAKEEQAPQ